MKDKALETRLNELHSQAVKARDAANAVLLMLSNIDTYLEKQYLQEMKDAHADRVAKEAEA